MIFNQNSNQYNTIQWEKNQFKFMNMKDHIPSTYIIFIHVTKRGVEEFFYAGSPMVVWNETFICSLRHRHILKQFLFTKIRNGV